MRRVLVFALAAALGGCDISLDDNDDPPPPGVFDPYATITTPGASSGNIPIDYSLIDLQGDLCRISVEFSTDSGAQFAPATGGTGGDGTTDLISSPAPGTPHTFVWNSLADGVGLAGPIAGVRIRITPTADPFPGGPATTADFTVDNSANTAPSITVFGPGATGGLVAVTYDLDDAEGNTCSISVEFSVNSGGAYSPATMGPGGDGLTGLAPGAGLSYVWNSFADGVAPGAPVGTVRIRITPSDGAAGSPADTGDFAVDNSLNGSGGAVGSFNGTGVLQVDPTVLDDSLTAAAADGRSLYVAGHDSAADSSWRIEKRNLRTGAPDASFGVAGRATSNPGAGLDRVSDAIVSGGSLFVAGLQEVAPTVHSWRVEKYSTVTGTLAVSFGTAGAVTTGPLGDSPEVNLVADSTHFYLVGIEEAGGDQMLRIEKRLLSTGQPDLAFGPGGYVTGNVNQDGDGPLAAVVHGGFLYLAGRQDASGDSKVRLEKRDLLSGELNVDFGVGGAVVRNVAVGGEDVARAIATDGTYLYVFGAAEDPLAPGTLRWRLEKLHATNGNLFASASSAGFLTHTSAAASIVLVGGDVYIAGPDGPASNEQWRIEKRSSSDLGLVTSFGTSGVVLSDPNPAGTDGLERLLHSGGVLYAAGQDSAAGGLQWRMEALWR